VYGTNAVAPPSALPYPTDPAQVPAEFRTLRHWVGWDWALRDDRWTKPPIDVHTGQPAKADDPSTWATFGEAVAYARRHRLAGIGVELTRELGIVGVDLDHCRDAESGVIAEWALGIVRRLDTWTQVSPSGTGLRLFVRGHLPGRLLTGNRQGRRQGAVELYQAGRYLTLTAERLR
jgi:putative DNA primase/helicase